MGFGDLKKQSSLGSLTAKLVKEVEKQNGGGQGGADERLWKPVMDKSGNGYAVIRFLPAPDGEDLPWAKMFSHAFQGNGGWYIENSLTTIGQKDPLGELNRELWNSGNDSDKDTVRKQKRKLSFYANIYVVKDPANPQNEGGVFLYKFGKKIFDKVMEAMQPEFEDEEAINPFDFWQGANFKLRAKKVAGYPNYDSSEFQDVGTLEDLDDAQLESIWKRQHLLQTLVAEDQFKTYEQLKTRLDSVLNLKSSRTPEPEAARAPEAVVSTKPQFTSSSVSADTVGETEEKEVAPTAAAEESEDDVLDYFKKLAEE